MNCALLVAEVALKALRVLHSASLHRWLLDVQPDHGTGEDSRAI